MTLSRVRFEEHVAEAEVCMQTFDATGNAFALRHVWIVCVSAFDLFMTELVSEAGLRLIDRDPPILTGSLRQVQFTLERVMDMGALSPTQRLLFYKDHIFSAVQYKSFYKPDKVSEALSYVWTSPARQKWALILGRLKDTGRYDNRTEDEIRDELTFIGDRRDLIAHSVDKAPGSETANRVERSDALRVIEFIKDLVQSIDSETEHQLSSL